MRLRILPLPDVVLGDAQQTPFALIFDRCTDEEAGSIEPRGVEAATGAAFVLATPFEVELS